MNDHIGNDAEQRRIQCQIRADIESALRGAIHAAAFRRVLCASADRTAILWGTVADEASRALAEHLAAHVENVNSVLNRIQVEESPDSVPKPNTLRMPHCRMISSVPVRIATATALTCGGLN